MKLTFPRAARAGAPPMRAPSALDPEMPDSRAADPSDIDCVRQSFFTLDEADDEVVMALQEFYHGRPPECLRREYCRSSRP